ncbi:hypothetical protein LXA43DRAFT_1091504 [Ganoderma leucocontextum]|nr:hypothetical protein LXA43DRAFT_1091504 [Ganoderma leucocontextum]
MLALPCRGCLKSFTTQNALSRHITASPSCLAVYDAESSRLAAIPPESRNLLERQPLPQGPVEQAATDLGNALLSNNLLNDPPFPPLLPDPGSSIPSKRRRVTVEEVEDEEQNPWIYETYPGPVATPLGEGVSTFADVLEEQESIRGSPHAPFRDLKEWEVVKWLMRRTTQTGISEYLKLHAVQDDMKLSFKSTYTMLKKVDALPVGPEWHCNIVEVTGDRVGPDGQRLTEETDLWRRDPVECIADLIGNPALRDFIVYEPVRIKQNGQRYYSEMCTGDWWWDLQGCLPPGAVVASVILASDKTTLSVFRGDKTAWPVYLTLGNIDKDIRRQPSKHASVLLGYIPVTKLACFTDASRSDAQHRLFHHCMKILLAPLVEAGKTGVRMTCADGQIRLIFPILAAYIADHPEQCLICCCKENRCPRCIVPRLDRGELTTHALRNQPVSANILACKARGEDVPQFDIQGLRPVPHPFWAELPHTNIFAAISPDILHQLHKGVIKEHLVSWVTTLVGKDELDARFKTVSGYHGLRHFKNGISFISQWTGAEAKEVEKLLLPILVGRVRPEVVRAVRGLIDFTYYAQLQAALARFHANKHIFIELGIRENFNIPKLHALLHYLLAILMLGCLDGLNTESSERLHIDYAKKAYRASSRRSEYIAQMTTWLQRQEALVRRDAFLAWVNIRSVARSNEEGEETATSTSSSEELDEVESVGAEGNVAEEPSGSQERTFKALHELITSNVSRAYQLPTTPSAQRVNLTELRTRYGAVNFLDNLVAFLHAHLPNAKPPNEFDTYAVFHYMSILLPPIRHISSSKRLCKLRATPARPRRGHHPASPAHFDCGLFIVDRGKFDREGGVNGLCAARVRAIFYLPDHIHHHPHPLLYVEWFRPFRGPEPNSGLYITSQSTAQHSRRHSISSLLLAPNSLSVGGAAA